MYAKVAKLAPLYMFPKSLAPLVGLKSPGSAVKRFKDFCEANPKHFLPYFTKDEVVMELEKSTIQLSVPCFLHYYKHRDLLDAGSRSVKFEQDIERIKLQLQLVMIGEESV